MKSDLKRKIISASRRTDIPAFFSKWFMNRIREGCCVTVNPRNQNQASYVSLRPEDVEVFVFWTRNPKPLLKHLSELDRREYSYYFFYTIVGYPREIEPFSPELAEAIETFQELSQSIGKEKVIWRYDPVLLSNLTDVGWHERRFGHIAEQLSGYSERVKISMINPFKKTVMRMRKETPSDFRLSDDAFDRQAYLELLQTFSEISRERGIEIQACAEEVDLSKCGICPGKCVDDSLITRITGRTVTAKKDPSQRKACHCVVSTDIGAYDTCLFGCRYCYATRSLDLARKNFRNHDPKSPSLLGWYDTEPPGKFMNEGRVGV